MPIHHDILDTIGRTPLIQLRRVSAGLPAAFAGKRTGVGMIPAASQKTNKSFTG